MTERCHKHSNVYDARCHYVCLPQLKALKPIALTT